MQHIFGTAEAMSDQDTLYQDTPLESDVFGGDESDTCAASASVSQMPSRNLGVKLRLAKLTSSRAMQVAKLTSSNVGCPAYPQSQLASSHAGRQCHK